MSQLNHPTARDLRVGAAQCGRAGVDTEMTPARFAKPFSNFFLRSRTHRTSTLLFALATAAAMAFAVSTVIAETGGDHAGLVDIGGFRLDHHLRGSGGPTVVFVSGANAPQSYWGDVPTALAGRVTTVTFDRAGFGASDPGPMPRHADHVASELKMLLDHIDAPRPYVLVAHSFGCIFARVFAGTYPTDVSGLVLLDPGHKDMLESFSERLEGVERSEWVGFWRAFWERYEERTDAAAWEIQAVDESLRLQRSAVLDPELRLLVVSALDPAHASPFVNGLSASGRRSYFRHVEDHHEETAALTKRGRRITALGTGHMIPVERPELVLEVVEQLLDEITGED